jgi:hypothetical protein
MKILGYVGAAFMIGFSFTMLVPLAIIGLLLLTVQAAKLKAYNLVILNLASLIGFFLQIA